jgi:hypothetical protein
MPKTLCFVRLFNQLYRDVRDQLTILGSFFIRVRALSFDSSFQTIIISAARFANVTVTIIISVSWEIPPLVACNLVEIPSQISLLRILMIVTSSDDLVEDPEEIGLQVGQNPK